MVSSITLLGSTGSIGTQTLDVVSKLGIRVETLAACRSVKTVEEQIRRYRPRVAAMFDEKAAADLRVRIADLSIPVLSGMDGLCELASRPEAGLVLNSVVGMVGLLPTLAAVNSGHDVALANKETLVAGGRLVLDAVRRNGVQLLPVDSEHSAIFQCLQGRPPKDRALNRLILTASGGPFFGKTKAELEHMRPEDALHHPNWKMGAKITIDSATMMNKGLELIEARWLFDVAPSQIDVVVHRESVVHSLIEYRDHSVIAQLGVPDMRIPIQYAITYPERVPSPVKQLELADYAKLTFFKPDTDAFPNIELCRAALERGGLYPAAVNGANEQAVQLFLDGKISFGEISRLAARVMDWELPDEMTTDAVLETDRLSRSRILDEIR